MKKLVVLFYISAVAAASAGDASLGLSGGVGYIGAPYTASGTYSGCFVAGVSDNVRLEFGIKYDDLYANKTADPGTKLGITNGSIFAVTGGFSCPFAAAGPMTLCADVGIGMYVTHIRFTGENPEQIYGDSETTGTKKAPGIYAGLRSIYPVSSRFAVRFRPSITLIKNDGYYSGYMHYEEFVYNKPYDDCVFAAEFGVDVNLGKGERAKE